MTGNFGIVSWTYVSVTLCRLWVLLKSSGECFLSRPSTLVKFRLQVSYSLLWVTMPISVQLSKSVLCCSGPVLNMQHSRDHLRLGQWFTSFRPAVRAVAVLLGASHMHRGKPKGLRWFIHQTLRVTFLALPSSPPHSLSSPQSLHFSVRWTRKMGFPSEF